MEINSLHTIVGTVGSGKSTLFQIILDELQIERGRLTINGTISYACQEPWLFEGTVRQNILFTEEYEEERQDIFFCLHKKEPILNL